MKEQLDQLYARIMFACASAKQRKQKKLMLLEAGELQSYLQCAFDHFASTLDYPFDFVKASFSLNPTTSDFGGSIVRMAVLLRDVARPPFDPPEIFKHLSMMIASCIMLDSARSGKKGNCLGQSCFFQSSNITRYCRSSHAQVS